MLPWLLVTTTNLARNHARGLRRYRALIDALPRSDDARSAGDVAIEHIGEVAVVEQVRQALNSLAKSEPRSSRSRRSNTTHPPKRQPLLASPRAQRRTRLHRARARMASALEASQTGDRDEITKEMLR